MSSHFKVHWFYTSLFILVFTYRSKIYLMYDIDMYVYRPERALGDPKVRRNGGGGESGLNFY